MVKVRIVLSSKKSHRKQHWRIDVAKLSIKYGDIAIDYEGPEDFLKSEMGAIVSAVRDLSGVAAPPATTTAE